MKRCLIFLFFALCVTKTFTTFSQVNTQDSLAIVDFYDSTNGPNWLHNTNWLTAAPLSSWYGVKVKDNRITGLLLYNNNLSGLIPLSFANLTDLDTLNLMFNQLTGTISAFVSNLSQLKYLNLAYNQLTGAIPESLGNLSNLILLALDHNLLNKGIIPSSLGNLTNLTVMELDVDSLTGSIPTSIGNLTNLSWLSLGGNQLIGSVPSSLGNLTNLTVLAVEGNQLTGSIPASLGNLKKMSNISLAGNNLSDSIPSTLANFPVLNYFLLYSNKLTFAGMEQLAEAYGSKLYYDPQANISLHYNGNTLSVSAGGTLANDTFHWYRNGILINTVPGDSTLQVTNTGSYSVTVTNAIAKKLTLYSDTVNTNVNELFGYAYLDLNGNNIKDSSEPLFNNGKIIVKSATDSTVNVTSDGNFRIYLDTGNYTSSFLPTKNYYTVIPQNHNSSFSNYDNIDTVHFALKPVTGKTDIDISMYALMPTVPGFGTTYRIRYQNSGTDTISHGDIQLVKDPRYNFVFSSPAYTSINGDTIHWSYSNLKPLDTASISVFSILPSGVPIGDTLTSVATISPVTNDLYAADDTAVLKQLTVGSYDPNNKSENHAGSVSTNEVKNGDYLTYTIRFQNTGTYAAFNIAVRDTLSDKLDWNSFEMVGASHNYQLSITGGNKCTWYFNGIGLPDSNSNEPASHGYIVYRVKLKKTLAAGNVINNTAGIYFDYNAPVQTNTEKTVVQNLVLPLQLLSFTAQRNNATNLLKWSTADEINTDHFEIQRSSNGKDFSAIGSVQSLNNGKITNNYQYTDNSPLKGVNFYRLKMVDKDGKYSYSSIKSINNASSFDVTVYPNPVKNDLVLDFISEKNLDMQLQIVNAEGRMIFSGKITVAAGESKQTINASTFSTGSYFIKLISSEGETALRFIKQ
jgi:uncharacterized repeat protein (TIGR01451 family)